MPADKFGYLITLILTTNLCNAQEALTQERLCIQLHQVDSILTVDKEIKSKIYFDLNLRGGFNYGIFDAEYMMYKLNRDANQMLGMINPRRDSVGHIISIHDKDSIAQKIVGCNLTTNKRPNVTLSKLDNQTTVAYVKIKEATHRRNSIGKVFFIKFDLNDKILDFIEKVEFGLNKKDLRSDSK